MRALIVVVSIFIMYFGFIPQASCQVKDSIVVHLSTAKREIEANSPFPITLRIESKQHRILEMPKGAMWGHKPEGIRYFSLEVQKKADGKYRDLKWNSRVDVPSTIDIDTLHYDDFREYTGKLDWLFVYSKGEYRVRVLCLFSSTNDTRDVYSNWAYFYSNQEMKGQ
jgi:hypothetical protein